MTTGRRRDENDRIIGCAIRGDWLVGRSLGRLVSPRQRTKQCLQKFHNYERGSERAQLTQRAVGFKFGLGVVCCLRSRCRCGCRPMRRPAGSLARSSFHKMNVNNGRSMVGTYFSDLIKLWVLLRRRPKEKKKKMKRKTAKMNRQRRGKNYRSQKPSCSVLLPHRHAHRHRCRPRRSNAADSTLTNKLLRVT